MMVSPMASLHSLGQDDGNEVQHDFFVHVMSLASASHDTNGTINGTWHKKSYNTSKQSSKQKKCNGVIDGIISIM